MNKNKNLAFTLAEVLIVIGIIGVVAALTLPNLNHATGDKETVTRVKKIYASLTDAFDRAQVIYGPYDTWFKDYSNSAMTELFGRRITEFMKISKDCKFETSLGCVRTGDTKLISGNTNGELDSSSYYKVITADGMSLIFNSFYNGTIVANITVDIDGPQKGAFTYGKDIFIFNIISQISGTESIIKPSSSSFPYGYNAASWIIENDNADYLKADSTGKCNDSNIILDGVTNTSCH